MANYKRVNKPTARKMFNMGCSILLLPCKVNDSIVFEENYGGFFQPITINITTCGHDSNKFDRTINEVEYYNCNAEVGYYLHYFVSEQELDKYKMCQLMCM